MAEITSAGRGSGLDGPGGEEQEGRARLREHVSTQSGKRWRLTGLVLVAMLQPLAASAVGPATVSDSFTDSSKINTTSSIGYQLSGGTLRVGTSISYGTGADGVCTVSSGTVSLSSASCSGRATADAAAYSSIS